MREGSRGVVVAAFAALAVIASFVAGKAARDAILLSEFPITQLPMFVGLAAVASLPVILLVGRLLAHNGPRRIVPIFNTVSGVMLIGEWFLLSREPQLGAAVIFFHLTSFGAVLVSGFWSIVNERFDARTARVHMGKIGAAATIGGIVGGVIAERAAVYLEPTAILLVIAGMQLACAVVQAGLARGIEHVPTERPAMKRAAIKIVAETPLLRVLAAVVVLGAVAATAIDYVFKAEVVAASGDEGPLRFFAIYYTATNIATAAAQIALARPVLEKIGVARTLATLPATVTVAGTVALAMPGLIAIVIARSGEMIVRSSVYRAAYELIYTPLAEEYKRSTKVLLDVGAERLGDLVGAQLVGLLVYLTAPSGAMVGVGIAAGVFALGLAVFALPRAYTKALASTLIDRAPDETEPQAAWSTVLPVMSEPGDMTLSMLELPRVTRMTAAMPAVTPAGRDPLIERIADLRSDERKRVTRALASPLPLELVPHVVRLLGNDEVVTQATAALRAIAPRCTGALVDTLLDTQQEFAVRRRLPAILEVGAPALATWGLTKGLADQRFEVRYRCAKALTRIRATGHDVGVSEADAFAVIERELSVDDSEWRKHRLLDPTADEDELVEQNMPSRGLEHVFDLLALALPPEPVRIARQALQTTDKKLRGTALEYLESVLPGALRDLLWPHVEAAPAAPATPAAPAAPAPPAKPRQRDAIITDLKLSHAAIMEELRKRAQAKG